MQTSRWLAACGIFQIKKIEIPTRLWMLPTLSLLHQLIDQWIDWCTERIKAQCGGSTNQGGLALISPSLVQSRTRSPCCTAQHEFLFTKEWKLLVSLTSVWISLLSKTTGTAATGNLQKRHQTFRAHATICADPMQFDSFLFAVELSMFGGFFFLL